MFGEFIKTLRLQNELSLRQFCRELDEDPSNWSKIEREVLAPPQDTRKLERIADILGLTKHSDEWNTLHDYAQVDAGKIPDYLVSDKEVIQALPAFFRTVGSVKPKPEEIEKLIDIIRKGK